MSDSHFGHLSHLSHFSHFSDLSEFSQFSELCQYGQFEMEIIVCCVGSEGRGGAPSFRHSVSGVDTYH